MLLRAILAAVIGTVAMTLSSTTEMQWVERPASVAPGLATARLLRPLGIKEVRGRALDILSTWTHWGYGALWGVVFWALIGPAGLPLGAAGALFFPDRVGNRAGGTPGTGARSVAVEVGAQIQRDRCMAPRRLCGRDRGRMGLAEPRRVGGGLDAE